MLALVALLVVAEMPIAEAGKPLWLLQRDPPTRITAVTFGTASNKTYTTNATLALACTGRTGTARIAVDVKALGFDSDPYEGPDATQHGPLKWTTGTGPGVAHPVSGYWGVAELYQVGMAFVFEMAVPADELARWTADGTRGQTVSGTLGSMTFAFKWPSNIEALRAACPGK